MKTISNAILREGTPRKRSTTRRGCCARRSCEDMDNVPLRKRYLAVRTTSSIAKPIGSGRLPTRVSPNRSCCRGLSFRCSGSRLIGPGRPDFHGGVIGLGGPRTPPSSVYDVDGVLDFRRGRGRIAARDPARDRPVAPARSPSQVVRRSGPLPESAYDLSVAERPQALPGRVIPRPSLRRASFPRPASVRYNKPRPGETLCPYLTTSTRLG